MDAEVPLIIARLLLARSFSQHLFDKLRDAALMHECRAAQERKLPRYASLPCPLSIYRRFDQKCPKRRYIESHDVYIIIA